MLRVTFDLCNLEDCLHIKQLIDAMYPSGEGAIPSVPPQQHVEWRRLAKSKTGRLFLVPLARLVDEGRRYSAVDLGVKIGKPVGAIRSYIRIIAKFAQHHQLPLNDLITIHNDEKPRQYSFVVGAKGKILGAA